MGTEGYLLETPHVEEPVAYAVDTIHRIPRNRVHLSIGKEVLLPPQSSLFVVTLESIRLPTDLIGLLSPYASLVRFGISLPMSVIHAGFRGKLVLHVVNHSGYSLVLRAGQTLVHLSFLKVYSVGRVTKELTIGAPMDTGESFLEVEDLNQVAKRVREIKSKSRAKRRPSQDLSKLISQTLASKGSSKGQALEELAEHILLSIKGLKIVRRNVRLKAEEIDLLVPE